MSNFSNAETLLQQIEAESYIIKQRLDTLLSKGIDQNIAELIEIDTKVDDLSDKLDHVYESCLTTSVQLPTAADIKLCILASDNILESRDLVHLSQACENIKALDQVLDNPSYHYLANDTTKCIELSRQLCDSLFASVMFIILNHGDANTKAQIDKFSKGLLTIYSWRLMQDKVLARYNKYINTLCLPKGAKSQIVIPKAQDYMAMRNLRLARKYQLRLDFASFNICKAFKQLITNSKAVICQETFVKSHPMVCDTIYMCNKLLNAHLSNLSNGRSNATKLALAL